MIGFGKIAIGIGLTGITIAVVHNIISEAKEENKTVKEVVIEKAANAGVKAIKFVAKHEKDITSIVTALTLVSVMLDLVSHLITITSHRKLTKRLDELEKLAKSNLKVNLMNGMMTAEMYADVNYIFERLNTDSMSSDHKSNASNNFNKKMDKVMEVFNKAFPNIAKVEVVG